MAGQGVREELGPRALREELADVGARGDVAAGGAPEGLAERAGDDVDLAAQAEVLRRPEPVLAEHADAVRVVEDHDRVVLAGERDDLGQPRQVALHREDAVGDHELALARLAGRELPPERLQVGVRVDRLAGGLGEPDRVDDRGVVERVREDHRALVGERGDERLVRVPARDVGQRRLAARQVGERALQLRRAVRTCRR